MDFSEIVRILIKKGIDLELRLSQIPPFDYTLEFYDENDERATVHSGSSFVDPGYIDFSIKVEGLPKQEIHMEIKEFEERLKSFNPTFSLRAAFGAPIYESDIFKYLHEIPELQVKFSQNEEGQIISEATLNTIKYTCQVLPDEE